MKRYKIFYVVIYLNPVQTLSVRHYREIPKCFLLCLLLSKVDYSSFMNVTTSLALKLVPLHFLKEVKECIGKRDLFTENPLKKAFFSYGSGIPKRTQYQNTNRIVTRNE